MCLHRTWYHDFQGVGNYDTCAHLGKCVCPSSKARRCQRHPSSHTPVANSLCVHIRLPHLHAIYLPQSDYFAVTVFRNCLYYQSVIELIILAIPLLICAPSSLRTYLSHTPSCVIMRPFVIFLHATPNRNTFTLYYLSHQYVPLLRTYSSHPTPNLVRPYVNLTSPLVNSS